MMCEVRRLSVGGPTPEGQSVLMGMCPWRLRGAGTPCARTGKGRAWLGFLVRRGIYELSAGAIRQPHSIPSVQYSCCCFLCPYCGHALYIPPELRVRLPSTKGETEAY